MAFPELLAWLNLKIKQAQRLDYMNRKNHWKRSGDAKVDLEYLMEIKNVLLGVKGNENPISETAKHPFDGHSSMDVVERLKAL